MLGNMCEEMFCLMNLELDGEISQLEQKKLDDHRKFCPHCAQLWEELCQMQSAVQNLDDFDEIAVPEGFVGRVLDQIQQETATPKIVPFRKKLIRYGSLAACAALCVGLYQSGIFQTGIDSMSTGTSDSAAPMAVMTTTTTTTTSSSTSAPEMALESAVEDRAVAEIYEETTAESASVSTTTATTADTSAGLTLPEQVAQLLGVEETAWIMILPDELPDPFLEGMGDLVVMEHFAYVIVEQEYWDDVRVELNFGVSIEAVEDGVPCVVIIMPE